MFQVYRAIKTNFLTQNFYDNKLDIYKKLGMTSHGGKDWLTGDNEKIYFDCSIKGLVLNTEIDNNGGLGINIITEENGEIFKHRYWHLKSFDVVAGQKVETGVLLGISDNTGYSLGQHLHRDMKPMLKINGIYKVKYPDNGTFGTIDYSNMLENIFVLDKMEYLNKVVDNLTQQVSILQKIINLLKMKIF